MQQVQYQSVRGLHSHSSRIFTVYKYVTTTYKEKLAVSQIASYSINIYYNKPSATCFWKSYSFHCATVTSYEMTTKQSIQENCTASHKHLYCTAKTDNTQSSFVIPLTDVAAKLTGNYTLLTNFLITANDWQETSEVSPQKEPSLCRSYVDAKRDECIPCFVRSITETLLISWQEHFIYPHCVMKHRSQLYYERQH